MARGRSRKKVEPEKQPENGVDVYGIGPVEAEMSQLDDKNHPKEPEKPEKEDFVTPFEAARLLNVPEATIQLWYDHGHLTGEGSYGHIRISRGSLFGARIKKLVSGPMG